MATWVKNHFSDRQHAMTTISVVSLGMGAVGTAIIILGAVLAH